MLADHTFDDHPGLDVVLVPGGFGTRTEVDNPVLIDWIRTVSQGCDWVADGNVVSSQGVSAGIDMALWLIGQISSPEHALATQRYIQYDPAPPYAG